MLLDAQNQFSDAQAITADAVGTNSIDLAVVRAMGNGEPLAVLFIVDVAADQTSGDEDYTFDVEVATNAAQSTGRQLLGRRVYESGTPDAPAQDADLLIAGYKFTIPIPPANISDSARYLGIRCDVTGTSPTVTFTAFLQPMSMIDFQNNYADGFTIT